MQIILIMSRTLGASELLLLVFISFFLPACLLFVFLLLLLILEVHSLLFLLFLSISAVCLPPLLLPLVYSLCWSLSSLTAQLTCSCPLQMPNSKEAESVVWAE